MVRMMIPLAATCAAIALGGCNETMNAANAGPVAAAPPPGLSLPSGASCSNEINRFQSIVKLDLETGNVEQKIYDQIQTDMARAAAACSAGKGADAHRIVAGSKARHGYRA